MAEQDPKQGSWKTGLWQVAQWVIGVVYDFFKFKKQRDEDDKEVRAYEGKKTARDAKLQGDLALVSDMPLDPDRIGRVLSGHEAEGGATGTDGAGNAAGPKLPK